MKDEYLIWKRIEDDCKRQIEEANEVIYINNNILKLAEEKLKKLPKPKFTEVKL